MLEKFKSIVLYKENIQYKNFAKNAYIDWPVAMFLIKYQDAHRFSGTFQNSCKTNTVKSIKDYLLLHN